MSIDHEAGRYTRANFRDMFSRCVTGFWVAGLGLAVLAGCGSDERSARGAENAAAASDPVTSPAAASATPAPAPATSDPASPATSHPQPATSARQRTERTIAQRKPATKQQLQKIVVREADLPSGWNPTESLSLLNPDVDAALARCMGVRDTTPNMVAGAESPSYTAGETQIGSVAASYRTEADLDVDFGMLTNPRLKPCLERFTRVLYEQLDWTVDSFSSKVTLAPAGSPDNVVGVLDDKLVGTVAGRDLVEYDRTAFIRGPLLEVQVEMVSVDEPIPAAIWNLIVAKVAARAAGR
jgi:hypothetical protein